MKKVGKTTRPFRYNHLPYESGDDRFKGLHPVDRVPKELWTEDWNNIQAAVTKIIPKKKKCKAKRLSEEALPIPRKEKK